MCMCPGLGRGFPGGYQSPFKWAYSLALYSHKKEQPCGRVKLASRFKGNLRIWQKLPRQGRVSLRWVPLWELCMERRNQGRREERAPSWWFRGSALCPPLSSVPPPLSPHRGKEGGEGTLKPPGLPWRGPQGKGEKSQSRDTAEPPRAQKSSEAPAWTPGVQRQRRVSS